MLKLGNNCKIYRAIRQLYSSTTSCDRLNHLHTPWFEVNSVLKQGDSLSRTLFNLFINDLITEVNSFDIGIDITDRNICSLLYADDLVAFAHTEVNLQGLLDKIYQWCNVMWCNQWENEI